MAVFRQKVTPWTFCAKEEISVHTKTFNYYFFNK